MNLSPFFSTRLPSLLTATALAIVLPVLSVSAEPTEQREWTSTANTKISAVAKECDGDNVLLVAEDGRELRLDLKMLIPADQEFLLRHFGLVSPPAAEGEPQDSRRPFVEDGLAHPIGEVTGPIDANGDGTYFVYLPKTLRVGRDAPLLFVSTAGGGKAGTLKDYIATAERLGWVLALSVEAKNGYPNFPEENFAFSKACVEHLQETLPLDPKRRFFTGGSGGGATSIRNCSGLDGAGAMPAIGYTPSGADLKKSVFVYGFGGATDYNRDSTARTVSGQGDRGVHRFYVGGHKGPSEEHIADGMFWLEGRFLGDDEDEFPEDRLDYEAATLRLIENLKESKPHRAYYWAQFLLGEDYEISGENRPLVESLAEELAADPINTSYVEGLAALDKFSDEMLAGGITGGQLKSAAEKLAEKFVGIPVIEELAKNLQQPEVKSGK